MSFLLFLLLSGVEVHTRGFSVNGDPVLLARAIAILALPFLVMFVYISFNLGWPKPWPINTGIIAASAPLACFSTDSLRWGLILTAARFPVAPENTPAHVAHAMQVCIHCATCLNFSIG